MMNTTSVQEPVTPLLVKLFLRLRGILRIRQDLEDPKQVRAVIEADADFTGVNLWILGLATLVASLGLNMNSIPVIIGAMLISPLMGPINALGYAVATYDLALLRRALKNLLFATVMGLAMSALYFWISPISTERSELLARTSPSFYDVLIAFFGGAAGIIAVMTRRKGNVIPGVAIATALIPPLCTAGYGLATAKFHFFFGALYLFLINCVFIAFSASLLSRLLHFPLVETIPPERRRKINRLVVGILALTALPSLYLGYRLILKERFLQASDAYVRSVSVWGSSFLLQHEISAEKRTVKLIYAGSPLSDADRDRLRSRAADFGIDPDAVEVRNAVTLTELRSLEEHLHGQQQKLQTELLTLRQLLVLREHQLDSLRRLPEQSRQLLQELRAFLPTISSASYFPGTVASLVGRDSVQLQPRTYLILELTQPLSPAQRRMLHQWAQTRLGQEVVLLIETTKPPSR